MSSETPVQLPPHFRETPPMEFNALEVPYHISDPNFPKHWDRTKAGQGVVVGVCDTGIDSNHPELVGSIREAKDFSGSGSVLDRNGHGTHVASTIVGKSVGVAPAAQVCMAKVLGDNGSGSSKDVARGIDWLVSIGCDIINLSLGSSQDDSYTKRSIENAIAAGVIVVAATGNERASRVGYPARHCVAIGAVDKQLRLAYFSNRGVHVDLVGYGVDVYAAVPGGKYARYSGTSMATPWVVGVGANRISAEIALLGKQITKTPEDLLKLETYVKDLGPDGKDTSYGRGFPDLDKVFYEQLESEKPPVDPNEPLSPAEGHSFQFEGVGRLLGL